MLRATSAIAPPPFHLDEAVELGHGFPGRRAQGTVASVKPVGRGFRTPQSGIDPRKDISHRAHPKVSEYG